MAYFVLEPEVAGELGPNTVMDTSVHPPLVSRLHYEVTGWLGDDLLETFPCFVVTDRLAKALATSGLQAFELRDLELSITPEAQEFNGDREWPGFRWLVVTGRAGVDDLGVTPKAQLVVSDKALELLRSFSMDNCDVAPHL